MPKFIHLGLFSVLFTITGCVTNTAQDQSKVKAQPEQHAHTHSHGNHDHTPHMGILAPFEMDGKQQGTAELKLHDDKGDLELWLTNVAGTAPFDLPLDTVITVSFPKLVQKAVELRVRNTVNNEDEDGVGTIRSGKTNYFIFPSNNKTDASFLIGRDFSSDVVISFSTADKRYITKPFILRPHTH